MKRVAIALIALLVGVAALPVVVAANEISDEPTCRDVNAGVAETDPGEDCFPGSTQRRAAVVGLLAVSAAAAVGAMVLGAAAAIRGGRGILFAVAILAAAGLFLGAFGAARF